MDQEHYIQKAFKNTCARILVYFSPVRLLVLDSLSFCTIAKKSEKYPMKNHCAWKVLLSGFFCSVQQLDYFFWGSVIITNKADFFTLLFCTVGETIFARDTLVFNF